MRVYWDTLAIPPYTSWQCRIEVLLIWGFKITSMSHVFLLLGCYWEPCLIKEIIGRLSDIDSLCKCHRFSLD